MTNLLHFCSAALAVLAILGCRSSDSNSTLGQTPTHTSYSNFLPLGEARELLGARLKLPTYLPDGIVLRNVVQVSFDAGAPTSAFLLYNQETNPDPAAVALSLDEFFSDIAYLPPPGSGQVAVDDILVAVRRAPSVLEASWQQTGTTFYLRLFTRQDSAAGEAQLLRVVESLVRQ